MTYSPRLHATCQGTDGPGNPCRCCCGGCLIHCAFHNADHAQCPGPKRAWFYKRDSWDWKWWQFASFFSTGDEWCNRTVVLRLWRPLVIALNVPLRRETCEECLEPYDPRPEGKDE